MAVLKANAATPINEKIALDACAICMYGRRMASRASSKRPSRARPRRPVQLAALRAFDAAARRLSFTLAAEELALTQSAISRQIATLEQQVGAALFVRKTRALALTAAGERLREAVRQALSGIDACVDAIRGVGATPRVAVTTYASFASLWLVPRLADFQHAHPNVEMRIDASDRILDLVEEGMDLALRRCLPSRLDAADRATLLCEEFVTPALSPLLLERSGVTLREPADLLRLPLLDMDDHWRASVVGSWQAWFEAFGVPRQRRQQQQPSAPGGRITFSYIDQAMQAAVRGQGAVMGHTPMLEDALAAGQLVAPFPELRLSTGMNYYLLVNPERAEAPEIAAFARWLAEEFARGPRRQT